MSQSFQVIVVAFFFSLVFGVATYVSAFEPSVFTSQSDVSLQVQIESLVNKERVRAGVEMLATDPALTVIAQKKADAMAISGEFSHTLSGGTTSWSLFKDAEYTFLAAGENLAVCFETADAVVEAWYNSPTHQANLISDAYTVSGIGIRRGTYDGFSCYFIVHLFARP